MTSERESLQQLIRSFQTEGYVCRRFTEELGGRELLLRHDVDFSLDAAVEVAEIESELGALATFFFLVSSDFYNVLALDSQQKIARIRDLGHTISLHYDPTIHADIDAGFELERNLFETLFSVHLNIVSLHRPQGFLDNNNRRLPGVRHTYEDTFFRDIHYVSDSRGHFAHGHPLESAAFREHKPIHLLLHPIWWVAPGSTPSDKLRSWQYEHHDFLLRQMCRNCKSFDGRSIFSAGVA
jgi:hypothetical protein